MNLGGFVVVQVILKLSAAILAHMKIDRQQPSIEVYFGAHVVVGLYVASLLGLSGARLLNAPSCGDDLLKAADKLPDGGAAA